VPLLSERTGRGIGAEPPIQEALEVPGPPAPRSHGTRPTAAGEFGRRGQGVEDQPPTCVVPPVAAVEARRGAPSAGSIEGTVRQVEISRRPPGNGREC